jgi:Phage integrase family
LQFDAIDWSQATFSVAGKSRREAKLPLPQEVGDALLLYLETARPTVDDNHIFITAIAPWAPITRSVVKSAAAQAMRRAGVEAPSFGAHILRHSAATALLRQGAPLQVIGEVLRHRCMDTTAHYAKIDVDLLQQVARPWPGGCAMLKDDIATYLAVRRAGDFKLEDDELYLYSFARFADAQGDTHVTKVSGAMLRLKRLEALSLESTIFIRQTRRIKPKNIQALSCMQIKRLCINKSEKSNISPMIGQILQNCQNPERRRA